MSTLSQVSSHASVSWPRRYAVLWFLVALVAVTALGFLGYRLGFLSFVTKIMMPEAFGAFSLLPLATLFGIAAFFSPCAFTVLPAYVSHYLKSEGGGETAAPTAEPRGLLLRGVRLGVIASLGVMVVNVFLGVLIALLGSAAPFAKDPREDAAWILGVRTIIGLLIAVMGILTITGRSLATPHLHRLLGSLGPRRSMFLYGALYNGAAFGCTGPILLGLMLYALQTGSAVTALNAFLVFALTMGVLMVLLTVLVAAFQGALIRRMFAWSLPIKKAAGVVMVVTGLAITALTLEGNNLFVRLFFPFLPC